MCLSNALIFYTASSQICQNRYIVAVSGMEYFLFQNVSIIKHYKMMPQNHLPFCNIVHLATMYFKLRFHIHCMQIRQNGNFYYY